MQTVAKPGKDPVVTPTVLERPAHHGGHYTKALDGRKHPIRGLWVRNGRYYARLTIEDQVTGTKSVRRIPLKDAHTVAEATAQLRRLQTKREDRDLPVIRRTPKFSEFADKYLTFHETVKHAKRARTLDTERVHIDYWRKHLGGIRLDQITRSRINSYIAKRQEEGVTGRTVNLGVTVLRNVLNHAIDEGHLKALPTENLRPLKWKARERRLFSLEQIQTLCDKAGEVSKNSQQFSDYIKLMAFCGSRMSETLGLKWDDVYWQQRQLKIGADGNTKNGKARFVDFNPQLEAHLKDMHSRKVPDSDWMFPSPQRGEKDRPAKTFRETLLMARKAAGIPRFGFHDCRHFFISMSVMAGIDYMTIARWVGHQDGGILIGKVYGHLSNEHAQRQARRLSFSVTEELEHDDENGDDEAEEKPEHDEQDGSI